MSKQFPWELLPDEETLEMLRKDNEFWRKALIALERPPEDKPQQDQPS